MDFFASQDLARRKTKWLIFYFCLAILCMVVGIYVVIMLILSGERSHGGNSFQAAAFFDPVLFGVVATSVSGLVGAGSLYKVAQLRGGGESVASLLGGRKLPPNSRDPVDRKILNVVEEMALAAGTPVPPVYLLDHEPGINAFAAGYTIDDAVIGINRGTVEQLTRDELQGVVAHEFSHILNGDMRISIRMIGVLHGILLLSMLGYYILRSASYMGGSRRSSSKDNNGGVIAILAIAVALIVFGSIGMFFARLIKASVSRQREYLADASAVQFTRNPEGIAGALKIIGANTHGSTVQAPGAEEASHMFFASMFRVNWMGMFATHPPLGERIQRIDPRFDGDYQAYANSRTRYTYETDRDESKSEPAKMRIGFPFGQGDGKGILPKEISDRFPIDPAILIAGIGLPGDDDVAYSEQLVGQIPLELADAARDIFSARCLVFAYLLDDDATIRQRQQDMILRAEGEASWEETKRLQALIQNLNVRFRLPIFEILQGTLTGMSPEQYETFRVTVDALIEADQKTDLFEFFLRHHLMVHLDRRYGKLAPPRARYRAIRPLADDISLLLAVLVRIGHTDSEATQAAFQAALGSLGDGEAPSHRLTERLSYPALAQALERLSQATPPIKKRVLAAAAIAITHDHQVTIEEAEIFRAMSESLDCPVPPVVAT